MFHFNDAANHFFSVFQNRNSTLHTLNFPKNENNIGWELDRPESGASIPTDAAKLRRKRIPYRKHWRKRASHTYYCEKSTSEQNAFDLKIFWRTVAIGRPNCECVQQTTSDSVSKRDSERQRKREREREEKMHLRLVSELINYADTGNSIVCSSLSVRFSRVWFTQLKCIFSLIRSSRFLNFSWQSVFDLLSSYNCKMFAQHKYIYIVKCWACSRIVGNGVQMAAAIPSCLVCQRIHWVKSRDKNLSVLIIIRRKKIYEITHCNSHSCHRLNGHVQPS